MQPSGNTSPAKFSKSRITPVIAGVDSLYIGYFGEVREDVMAYVLIALLAILIFLSVSDFVEAVTEGTAEWERARDLSKKHPAR